MYMNKEDKTVIFNGVEINAPLKWTGSGYNDIVWIANIMYPSPVHPVGIVRYFDAGLVFETKDDAQAYRKAAGWIV